jgi:5-methylthioadenosine/S-adenosylhomocysteine deaminase
VLTVPTILAHACGALPSDIEILAQYQDRVGIAHAPKTYLKLAMDIAPVTEFRQAGLSVGLATDGAASNSTLDLWESLRLLAMMQKFCQKTPEVLSVSEALYIATVESGCVFGLQDQLGRVESGYLADLILIDLSGVHHQPNHNIPANLVYSLRPEDVQTVIIDGQIVMRSRQILTLDKTEVINQVGLSLNRLQQRQKQT